MTTHRKPLLAGLIAATLVAQVPLAHADELPAASLAADTDANAQAIYNKAHTSITNQDCHDLLYSDTLGPTSRAAAGMQFPARTALLHAVMDQAYPGLIGVTNKQGQDANAILGADMEKRLEKCEIVGPVGEQKYYKDAQRNYAWLHGTTVDDVTKTVGQKTSMVGVIDQLIELNRTRGTNPPAGTQSIPIIPGGTTTTPPPTTNTNGNTNTDNNNGTTTTPPVSDTDKLISKLMTILSIVGVIAALIGAIHESFPNLFPHP